MTSLSSLITVIDTTRRWPKVGNSASSGRMTQPHENDSPTWRNPILSYQGSWVCHLSWHPWQSHFCMVGAVCTCEAQLNHICCE
jgi:hypothetical protein